MASKNNLTKQEKSVNNTVETNPKGATRTEKVIGGNPIGDRLWLEHFANNSLLMHGRLFQTIIKISAILSGHCRSTVVVFGKKEVTLWIYYPSEIR